MGIAQPTAPQLPSALRRSEALPRAPRRSQALPSAPRHSLVLPSDKVPNALALHSGPYFLLPKLKGGGGTRWRKRTETGPRESVFADVLAMPRYAMLCYPMLCYALPWYAMPCYVMQCLYGESLQCYAMLCHALPCYAIMQRVGHEQLHSKANEWRNDARNTE